MSRPFVSSSSNPRLKTLRRLRRARGEAFVVEGHRQLACALDARARVRALYVAPELFLGERDAELVALAERRGADVVELSAAAFASIAGNARPDGIVALVERPAVRLGELRPGREPLLLVAEAIERPGNLGTVVRAACAAGAGALLACDCVPDLFHPDVVRGSVGTLFRLPVATASTAEAISWLRRRGIAVVVATPEGRRAYWEYDYTRSCAVVVGNERGGVSRAWLETTAETVAIPMPGPADSVNVAVAAGVVMFEAARQRSAGLPRSRRRPRRPGRGC